MARPQPIDRARGEPVARSVEIRTILIPSIPLVEARERFLTELRWKTSRLSGRRLTQSTADKYRLWLQRFERWLLANGLPLDLGAITEDHIHQLQADVLDEIDDGTLEESSASTYVRCIKTFFNESWVRLAIEPATNPTIKLRAGSQQAVDFPLFRPEHVRALLRAANRPRTGNSPAWIAYRDQTLLACFFDLGELGPIALRSNDGKCADSRGLSPCGYRLPLPAA